MPSDEKWYNILTLINREARGIALISLLANAAVLAIIPLVPSEQRIYGFIVFACVLIGTLVGTVVVTRSTSQDHTQPQLRAKVKKLKDMLVADQFLPQLIIAIPRGGLAVAGLLAIELGDGKIVPVICLTRSQRPGFDNSFNHMHFTRDDFGQNGEGPIHILIVDDICRSGRTLNEASGYVEGSLGRDDFLIKTAVISFYHSYSYPIPPSYFVDRPEKSVRDASGQLEPMPD